MIHTYSKLKPSINFPSSWSGGKILGYYGSGPKAHQEHDLCRELGHQEIDVSRSPEPSAGSPTSCALIATLQWLSLGSVQTCIDMHFVLDADGWVLILVVGLYASKSRYVQHLNMIFLRAWYLNVPQQPPPPGVGPAALADISGGEEEPRMYDCTSVYECPMLAHCCSHVLAVL